MGNWVESLLQKKVAIKYIIFWKYMLYLFLIYVLKTEILVLHKR